MTYILSVITIITMILAGNKSRWAWIIGLGNQGLWLSYIVHTRQYGLLLMTVAIIIVYARNLLKWRPTALPSDVTEGLCSHMGPGGALCGCKR